jgi:citrate synthase
MANQATLKYNDQSYDLPVVEGTENELALDISTLRDKSGFITLDSGYKNTGATKSAITFLDGELGILRYRGYPIDQLAEKSTFTEVIFLLLYGSLPTSTELSAFEAKLADNVEVPAQLAKMLEAFPADAHPMAVISSLTTSLSAYYGAEGDFSKEGVDKVAIQLLAKLPILASWALRGLAGKPLNVANSSLDYTSNLLSLFFAEDSNYKPEPTIVQALNTLLILHADHEQNCSASTVRMVGSSRANLFASVSAGISALWGPLHGGANQEVIEMLEAIKADGGDTMKYINKAKDKNDGFRLMGFGHRVYKNFDPRARIIKAACDNILSKLGVSDPVLKIAKELEEAALNDPYFVERKLYPNVDFYSGIIYRALGIPVNMFTVMFALGRLPGWISQWKEMIEGKEPIGRPRQVYVGALERDYVAIGDR